MKCKCFMEGFSQNIFFLRLQLFFLAYYSSNQLSFFSGSSKLEGSCYWWSIFFLFGTITMKSDKVFFSVSLLNTIMQLIIPNYAWKYRVK